MVEFTFGFISEVIACDCDSILNSVSAIGPLDDRVVFALLVKVKVPAHAADWDDERGEQEYERGYFEVLVLRVAVDDADWDDRVAERDQTDQQEPGAGQEERRSAKEWAASQCHWIKIFNLSNIQQNLNYTRCWLN